MDFRFDFFVLCDFLRSLPPLSNVLLFLFNIVDGNIISDGDIIAVREDDTTARRSDTVDGVINAS